MLAMLGDFFFEINKNAYQELSEILSFNWAEHPRALDNTHYEAVGGTDERFSMSGTLILENIHSLEALKDIGRNQQPILLVFGTGFAYWVIMRELEIDYTRFITGGSALKRNFTVQLTRYYHD